MLKRCLLLCLVLLGSLAVQASPKNEITMLVVPRDAKTIQIAQDISRHYPILLVSYQQTSELLKLYAWNGEGWVELSIEDYENGVFFENPPQQAIIIEKENTPAAEILVPNGIWCEKGNRLTTTDPRAMVHLLGLYFDFPNRYWKNFSKTTGLSVADINPGLVNIFWWQHPEKRPTLNPKADMEHWLYLDITPPEPIEPVVVEEEPEAVLPAEVPAEVPAEKPVEEVIEEVVETEPVLIIEELEKVPEIVPAVVEVPVAEKIEPVIEEIEEAKPEAKEVNLPEESAEDILNALKPAARTVIDPFSTDDIPAAKIVLPQK